MDSLVADASQATKSGLNISTQSIPPGEDISPAVRRSKLRPKVDFKVAYDLGRGDEAQQIRATIPKDETYRGFLRRLHHVFYGDSFERSLRQWEYVLVSRQYKKGDPLPMTSSNTYYAMVSELLKPRSRWRHAVVQRSHSENPIIRAIAEGTFYPAADTLTLDATMSDVSFPDYSTTPDASEPGISIPDTQLVADASIVDAPMADAPTDQTTPERLTSTPPSRAWIVKSASATPLSRTPSPGSPPKRNTQELYTPSTPVPSKQGRPSLTLSSPLTPASKARDRMQPYLPLISSPLARVTSEGGQRSMWLSSPIAAAPRTSRLSSPVAPVTNAPRPSLLSPPLAPVVSSQSLIPPDSSRLGPTFVTETPQIKVTSPSPPVIAQPPAIATSSTTSPATSVEKPFVQPSSTPATAAFAQDPTLPLGSVTSPTAARVLNPFVQLSPPLELAASARGTSEHSSSPNRPTASVQAPPAISPVVSGPSSQYSKSAVDPGELSSQSASALITPRSPTAPQIPSGSAASSTPASDFFRRPLNLPPRSTSTSTTTSSVRAPPTNPTHISRPRRPLWISGQRVDSGTEYLVHWNNGRKYWEAHDSLYRDYPAFVDRYLEGRQR